MARLSTKQRKAMKPSEFALPAKRAFPIEDKTHAEKALQLAPRARKAGNITAAQERTIEAKAKAKLGKSTSRAKK